MHGRNLTLICTFCLWKENSIGEPTLGDQCSHAQSPLPCFSVCPVGLGGLFPHNEVVTAFQLKVLSGCSQQVRVLCLQCAGCSSDGADFLVEKETYGKMAPAAPLCRSSAVVTLAHVWMGAARAQGGCGAETAPARGQWLVVQHSACGKRTALLSLLWGTALGVVVPRVHFSAFLCMPRMPWRSFPSMKLALLSNWSYCVGLPKRMK